MITIYDRILEQINSIDMNFFDLKYILGACDCALWCSSLSYMERAKLKEIAFFKYKNYCNSLKG